MLKTCREHNAFASYHHKYEPQNRWVVGRRKIGVGFVLEFKLGGILWDRPILLSRSEEVDEEEGKSHYTRNQK